MNTNLMTTEITNSTLTPVNQAKLDNAPLEYQEALKAALTVTQFTAKLDLNMCIALYDLQYIVEHNKQYDSNGKEYSFTSFVAEYLNIDKSKAVKMAKVAKIFFLTENSRFPEIGIKSPSDCPFNVSQLMTCVSLDSKLYSVLIHLISGEFLTPDTPVSVWRDYIKTVNEVHKLHPAYDTATIAVKTVEIVDENKAYTDNVIATEKATQEALKEENSKLKDENTDNHKTKAAIDNERGKVYKHALKFKSKSELIEYLEKMNDNSFDIVLNYTECAE